MYRAMGATAATSQWAAGSLGVPKNTPPRCQADHSNGNCATLPHKYADYRHFSYGLYFDPKDYPTHSLNRRSQGDMFDSGSTAKMG